MDGKNFLYLTDRRYDVVINGADIPAYSASAPMFAREHFENVREHLAPGGLFITKLHMASTSESGFSSILGTFLDVYPYVTIWFPGTRPITFFYLVGSSQQQLFSIRHIEDELKEKDVRDSIAYLYFHDSLDVLSCYVGDQDDIRRFLRDFHINSDYTPYVEFDINRREPLMLKAMFKEFIETVRTGSVAEHIDWGGMSGAERKQLGLPIGLVQTPMTLFSLCF